MLAAANDGDVSLARRLPIGHLTRPQRRILLAALDNSPRALDVYRRRDLWLGLFSALHPFEHADRFPNAAALAQTLMTQRRDPTSIKSRIEAACERGDWRRAAGLAADESPGIFIRRFRHLYANVASGERPALVEMLSQVTSAVNTRMLWNLDALMADNGNSYPRLTITLSGTVKEVDQPQGHLAVTRQDVEAAQAGLRSAIAARLSRRPTLAGESVWIDHRLEQLVLPDEQRFASDGLATLARGSVVDATPSATLRLFVHWREPAGTRSDLDLSVLLLDRHFNVTRYVDWTNLASLGAVHSGDLTSAPAGASEFIDVHLPTLTQHSRVRYIAPAVFRYAGPNFVQLPEAVVGWSWRDTSDSHIRTFDIKTVANAFRLSGDSAVATPMIYDIVAKNFTWIDLYRRDRPAASVASAGQQTMNLVKAVTEFSRWRPNQASVVTFGLQARGATIVDDRAAATITVGLDDGEHFNVLRPASLLAEVL